MAVSSPSILKAHRRCGAILVYAMVFCIAAAVAIYVASSVYQARVASSSQGNYAAQRALINWSVNHAARGAKQNSLDSGQGMADESVYDVFFSGLFYANGDLIWLFGDPPDEYADFYNVRNHAQLALDAYFVPSQGGSLWVPNNLDRRQDSMSGLNAVFSNRNASKSSFSSGDMLTIPGWRPRRHANESGQFLQSWDYIPYQTETQESAANQGFVQLRDAAIQTITSRGDLPFDQRKFEIPGNGWIWPNGYLRWVRDRVNYILTARDSAVAAAVGTVNETATTWAVEEPITNYQLLLLEPDTTNASGWRLQTAGAAGGRVEIDTSFNPGTVNGSSVNLINRAKIFVWGPVASDFASDTVSSIRGLQTANVVPPLAAIVRGQAPTVSSANDFEWRTAKPSTTVSFGRGVGTNTAPDPDNPGQFNSLSNYLSSPIIAAAADRGWQNSFDRKLEIYNAQNTRMPLNPVGASKEDLAYVNSVLTVDLSILPSSGLPMSFGNSEIRWSLQGTTSLWGAAIDEIGNMDRKWRLIPWPVPGGTFSSRLRLKTFSNWDTNASPSPYDPFAPAAPYLQNVGNLEIQTPPANPPTIPPISFREKIGLRYGLPLVGPFTDYTDDFGVAVSRYTNGFFDRAVVDIDLKKFGLDSGIKVAEGPINSAWGVPREIHIKAPRFTTVSGNGPWAPAVIVRIFGNDEAGAADLPPVKIVFDGGQPAGGTPTGFPINAVHLIPDLTTLDPNFDAGNRRRFILMTTNMYQNNSVPGANIYLQQRGNNSESKWYGVIIATNGLNFSIARENSNNFYSRSIPQGAPTFGTTTFTPGIENSRLSWMGTILVCNRLSVTGNYALRIAPDDGGGVANGADSPNSVYRLFTPRYNASIPTEYPVPMVVPRMVWNFE